MKPTFFLALVTVFLTQFISFDLAYPADPPSPQVTPQSQLTEKVVKAKIKKVAANADLDKDTKADLTNRYQTVLGYLEMAHSNDKAADEFLKIRKTAPEQTRKIRTALEQEKQTPFNLSLEITKDTSLSQIEQLLINEEANLAAIQARLSDSKSQLASIQNRPAIIQQELTQAKERQAHIADEIKIPSLETESPLQAEARKWILSTEEPAIRAKIEMLENELRSQPMRIELLRAQIEKMTWEIKPVQERVHQLQERVNELRLAKAEKTEVEAKVAQQMSLGKHSLVQMLAKRNAELSQDISGLATSLEDITDRKDDVTRETEQLQENFQGTKQRIEFMGMSQILGKAFTEQYRTLQILRSTIEDPRLLDKKIAEINLAQIQYNDERRQLKNLSKYISGLTADLSKEESDQIQTELSGLAIKRQELLNQALLLQKNYLVVLNELNIVFRRHQEIIETYSDFLSKYLLWIRNASFPKLEDLMMVPDQIIRTLSPDNWRETYEILIFQTTHSSDFVPLLVLALIILVSTKRLRRILEGAGQKVGQPASDRFIFTLQALGLTLLIAAPWPLLMAVLGWKLNLPEASLFTQSVSIAFLRVAPAFYFLQIFHALSIPNGFAAVHLRWSATNLQKFRFELRWFMAVFLPVYFIGAIAVFTDYGGLGGELGRMSIIVLLITIAVIFYRLLGPGKGVLSSFLAQHPKSFLNRFHRFWFALALALPLLMATLTLSGYIFSSGILFGRLYHTVGLITVLVVLYFLAVRWVLMVLSRKESFKSLSTNDGMQVKEPETGRLILDHETRKLISNVIVVAGVFGLWLIWSDVLPALGILNNMTLWYHTSLVSGVTKNLPVTLGDGVLAALIIFLTLWGLKHFSAFLEIVLRQWSSIRPGTRYAIITLSSYAILAGATAYIFSLLGGSWEEIQWIFAALGVGIGFGLQEIVANFISGLIILFERPVRIGDFVTIGDIDGTISRIQIRATTITTVEKKELLVPNKEFITGRLINWSLSDPITRIRVSVKVDNGSDLQKTMTLMSQAAEENYRILKNPAPFVTIEGFVDNKLTLNLLCYIDSIEHRLRTISELHEEIARKFKEAGIVVPPPQRDLHLNTPEALDIHLKQDDKKQDS